MSAQANTNVTLNEDGSVISLDVVSKQITLDEFKNLELKPIGLVEADFEQVLKSASTIDINNSQSINGFGHTLGLASKDSTSKLLEMVKAKDLDVTGRQLNQVLTIAQSSNKFGKNGLTKIPLIGGFLDKITKSSQNFINNLKNTDEMLDTIVGEIESNQKGLGERIEQLDIMFNSVEGEYHELGVHIASGRLVVKRIDDAIDDLKKDGFEDQLNVQKINDLTNTRNRLDKRVSDLYLLQQSCLQTLPQIRLIQNNSSALIDKFHSIKAVTIPAWRNQISLTLSLEDQQQSVKLTTAIDNTTNDLLKRNAAMLRQNSIETAKSNQRSVIEVETLKTVQNELIATVKETMKISEEGRIQRLNHRKELEKLQLDLNKQVAAGSEALKIELK